MKTCSACKVSKPMDSFATSRSTADGKAYKCRACCKLYKDGRKEWNAVLRRASYEKNKEAEKASSLAYYRSNRESRIAKHRAYMQATADQQRQWREDNKHLSQANVRRYREALRQRVPIWMTEKQLLLINGLYELAAQIREETGEMYHVDHIYPLRGEKVSGLHVFENLQIILGSENASKGNSYEPD